jgi:hypothetical protein
MGTREALIRSMGYVPFIYSCNGELTCAALGVRTSHTVYLGTDRGAQGPPLS